ncbi:MAG: alpha/beta hydrolase [Desulfobacterales bacterium]|nr:alpha/beta hydrolase [Desulfobacterales bacterium]
MPFIDVENGRLFYEVSGKGHPLVLLHGAWASHRWWRWQVPELSRYYRVIALDARGHGQSTPLEKVYSVYGFVRDLEIVLNFLCVEKPILIGWSMGGIISMQYCIDFPENVKALVLIATRGHKNSGLKLKVMKEYFQAQISLMMDLAAPRAYDPSEREPSKLPENWLKREVKRMLSPYAPKDVYDWVLSDLRDNPRKHYFEIIKSLWNWKADNKLKEIVAPTLIMVGEEDVLTPLRFSHLLHGEIPNSQLVVVEKASHYLALERHEIVNAEILKFLNGIC